MVKPARVRRGRLSIGAPIDESGREASPARILVAPAVADKAPLGRRKCPGPVGRALLETGTGWGACAGVVEAAVCAAFVGAGSRLLRARPAPTISATSSPATCGGREATHLVNHPPPCPAADTVAWKKPSTMDCLGDTSEGGLLEPPPAPGVRGRSIPSKFDMASPKRRK